MDKAEKVFEKLALSPNTVIKAMEGRMTKLRELANNKNWKQLESLGKKTDKQMDSVVTPEVMKVIEKRMK